MTLTPSPPGWLRDPSGGSGQRYWDGTAWADAHAPSGPPAEPDVADPGSIGAGVVQTDKGRRLVVAGLITSCASLLLCPVVGSLAGAGLTFAGQQTTPAGRRRSLGRLPLISYLACALGVVGWMTAFSIAAATAPEEQRAQTAPTPSTTSAGPEVALPALAPFTTVPVPSDDAQLLAALRVAPENDPGGYDRDAFDYPAGGTDGLRSCNTRARVLQRDSTVPAQVTYPGCKVVAGRWVDGYTGTAYEDPALVSIDHLVPLKEAYRSGASSWSPATMAAFANDIDRIEALKVIGGSGNAAKGDKDPSTWKPPLQSAWPGYARAWLVVKVAYGLTADQAEADALGAMLAPPPPPTTTPPPPPTVTVPPPAIEPTVVTSPPTTRPPTTTRPPARTAAPVVTVGPGGVSYANCAAVRAAGAAPLYAGEPGYRAGLDRDGDGIACE